MAIAFMPKDFEAIEIIGTNGREYKGYYSPNRIRKSTLPKGWFLYELRTDLDRISTIEPHCYVDFDGTFITKDKIVEWFGDNEDRYITIEDWNYLCEFFEERERVYDFGRTEA